MFFLFIVINTIIYKSCLKTFIALSHATSKGVSSFQLFSLVCLDSFEYHLTSPPLLGFKMNFVLTCSYILIDEDLRHPRSICPLGYSLFIIGYLLYALYSALNAIYRNVAVIASYNLNTYDRICS